MLPNATACLLQYNRPLQGNTFEIEYDASPNVMVDNRTIVDGNAEMKEIELLVPSVPLDPYSTSVETIVTLNFNPTIPLGFKYEIQNGMPIV